MPTKATLKRLFGDGARPAAAFATETESQMTDEEMFLFADLADKVAEMGSYCIIGNSIEVKNNKHLFSSINELLIALE
ncbi:hypothetical protein HMSSN036_63950 [Paenibacillus macerans]|uniref:hypothetical protein n=1 Tax=Paenibacillus sp. FSL R5-0527 TaxID=2975321 RepID=UPI00097A3F1C|nr:hypothetical protein BK140_05240 [Paenibacillus macerans]GJM74179.1 hypothetical protein HMSSN036_63950 [Paenibacillus macerans]